MEGYGAPWMQGFGAPWMQTYPWMLAQSHAMAPEWTGGGHSSGKGNCAKGYKGKFGGKGKDKGKKGKGSGLVTATAAICPPLCGASTTRSTGSDGSASVVAVPPTASTSPAGAAAPTPALVTATLTLRALKRNGFRVQSSPLRSVKRVAEYMASDTLHLLPKSKRSCGLCWMAVGLEPETFESPQILEVIKKEEDKLVVAEKPNSGADQAAKPEIEKADLTETPSKKRKAKLPRLADFLPQVPGPLGPIQAGETVAVAAAKVDQKDI